ELSYLTLPKEMNPFLGYRAIRLCLDRPDIFNTQLRALLRASFYGNLCIMFPMIATIEEFRQAKAMVKEQEAILKADNVPDGEYLLITMVEIPAIIVIDDKLERDVDFLSIGRNVLIKFPMVFESMTD